MTTDPVSLSKGLKIPVWTVRFCPWAPSYRKTIIRRLASGKMSVQQARRLFGVDGLIGAAR